MRKKPWLIFYWYYLVHLHIYDHYSLFWGQGVNVSWYWNFGGSHFGRKFSSGSQNFFPFIWVVFALKFCIFLCDLLIYQAFYLNLSGTYFFKDQKKTFWNLLSCLLSCFVIFNLYPHQKVLMICNFTRMLFKAWLA